LLLVRALLTASLTSGCWGALQPTNMKIPNKVAVAIAHHINLMLKLGLLIVNLHISERCFAVPMGR
jgi:hypothetical protein